MKSRHRTRGTVLLIVLLLASMMLVTAAAWLEGSVVVARNAANLRERALAFHAADSALIRCSRMALDSPPADADVTFSEPVTWRLKASFEGLGARAVAPFSAWPHAFRPPQCLVEAWRREESTVYFVTARGFGTRANVEAWLQVQLEVGGLVRHWRRVVARPF